MNRPCDIRHDGPGGQRRCATCEAVWDIDNDEESPCEAAAARVPGGIAGLVGLSILGAAAIGLGTAWALWGLDQARLFLFAELGVPTW